MSSGFRRLTSSAASDAPRGCLLWQAEVKAPFGFVPEEASELALAAEELMQLLSALSFVGQLVSQTPGGALEGFAGVLLQGGFAEVLLQIPHRAPKSPVTGSI